MAFDAGEDKGKSESNVALSKGALVGHYRIVEKIGAGGMGEVYLAEDIELNRKIASSSFLRISVRMLTAVPGSSERHRRRRN